MSRVYPSSCLPPNPPSGISRARRQHQWQLRPSEHRRHRCRCSRRTLRAHCLLLHQPRASRTQLTFNPAAHNPPCCSQLALAVQVPPALEHGATASPAAQPNPAPFQPCCAQLLTACSGARVPSAPEPPRPARPSCGNAAHSLPWRLSPSLNASSTSCTFCGLALKPMMPTRHTLPAVGPRPPAISRL